MSRLCVLLYLCSVIKIQKQIVKISSLWQRKKHMFGTLQFQVGQKRADSEPTIDPYRELFPYEGGSVFSFGINGGGKEA